MPIIDHHDNMFSMGYYQVGNRKYADKLDALVAGSSSNIHPEWNFHRAVFDLYDWKGRSYKPLRQLYKERAQQLRDKYDYLTLNYSGGSDSYTVLRAFLDNHIQLDEVNVRWAVKATRGIYTPDATNPETWYILSEWDLAIKPDLEYLAQHHPEIKITVEDFSDKIEPVLSSISEKTVENCGTDWLGLGAFLRLGAPEMHIRTLEKGRGSAVILGIDKPRVIKRNGQAYIYFLDIITNFGGSHKDKNIEAFYWTPDFPDIIREQGHVILDYFKLHPELHDFIQFEAFADYDKKQVYDQITRGLVYPDWNPQKFQAKKAASVFHIEIDTWLHARYQNTGLLNGWRFQLNNLLTGIDKKYITYRNNRADGFVGFISPFYQIGYFDNEQV